MELRSTLAEILTCQNVCSSQEEAQVLSEIILDFDDDGDTYEDNEIFAAMEDFLVEKFIDDLGITDEQAKAILLKLKRRIGCTGSDDEGSDDSEGDDQSVKSSSSVNDSEEDDDVYLLDGECELCDRYIKLTKHHSIPKSTWPRMQAKLLQAAEANENGDRKRSLLILGHGLEDLLGENYGRCHGAECRFVLSSDKSVIRSILHDTCDICRQCHTTVHQTHTNMELALNYNSVDKLLEDERISKFCKWASKQKAGKYKRG